ncbi:DUF1015 domain-containing protein [Methanocalculus sp.]|uniref:DUF1015 domain-containing protein n=1 Tax=Methanocalculus sp. TaxID=2004547 RepID=UPI00272419DE|nr:DUF1015 family protein [Methanocalculus sp.]MDO8840976.1 DUF1015 family protein [Methanocalculus sp.]
MVGIYPFVALRPAQEESAYVPSVPYDVVSAEEAAACIAENRKSFLRVIRSDAELPDLPPYDDAIYARARAIFEEMKADGLFVQDTGESYSVYQVEHGGQTFTGLVACVGVDDYLNKTVKRHELTRYDKEEDRTRHIDSVNANTGQVFLLYRDPGGIHEFITSRATGAAIAETVTKSGSVHRIYPITDPEEITRLSTLFADVSSLYIADGHHRAKSAVNVCDRRKERGDLTPEATRFMGVLFAHDSVLIHGYSRLIRDLSGMTRNEFLSALADEFTIREIEGVDTKASEIRQTMKDAHHHILHLYIDGRFYELSREIDKKADTVSRLDVTLLQEKVLSPLLGITDPRGDKRLEFMGGAHPIHELISHVDSGDYAAAILMQPVRIEDLCEIADNDGIMPPKSTWFEPKLLSGLVIHTLD